MKSAKHLAAALAATMMMAALAGCEAQPAALAILGRSPAANGGAPASPSVERSYSTDALLFAGSGTWGSEVSSLESILSSHGASYIKVSSAQLESMSVDDIAKFGVLIFPGGYGTTQTNSLSVAAHTRLREAVRDRGVSYLGFCAGAFIAVAPPVAPGVRASYGFGIVAGDVLDYYYLENQGVTAAMTMTTFADGTKRDLLWYGGPTTPDSPGSVVAKYPDGTAAISEMWSENGFVVLSGPHPTATTSVKGSFGLSDSDGNDFELTWTLINAALHQQPLPTF